MSRLLYRLSYPAADSLLEPGLQANTGVHGETPWNSVEFPTDAAGARLRRNDFRAPMRNRTADLLLTMETLYRLSYRGVLARP
jgi:hypothetical protein